MSILKVNAIQNLAGGTIFQYGVFNGQINDISNFTSDDLSEGTTNRYYLDSRARNAISVSGDLGYDNLTGVISFTNQWGGISGTLSAQTDLQNALDAKQNTLVSGTSIKTVNGISLLGSGDLTLSGSGNATWGSIGGTLSDQTDLQNALDAKQNTLVSGTSIKTVNGASILGSGDIDLSTGLTLSGTDLKYTNIDGTEQTISLAAFLDDTTNTVTSAALSGNTITFTREDSTTFELDVTNLYDDTNLVTSVNDATGAVTVQPTLVSGTNIKTCLLYTSPSPRDS